MYKARDNKGLYYELKLLIDYIDDNEDLNLLNELLIDFKYKSLNTHDIKLCIELIETYLPNYIECDKKGCYIYQNINSVETYTCFSELETEYKETSISKQYCLV